MKILYLSRGYTPHDHRFLSAIAQAAERTYFGRLNQDWIYETRPLPGGVEEVDWLPSVEAQLDTEEPVQALAALLGKIQPDLVHAGPIPSVAYMVAQTGFSPLVSMSWGSDVLVEAGSDPARSTARSALANSALAFADCRAVEQALVELGMPPDKIVVFPWGVDLSQFSPGPTGTLRDELGWGEDDFVVLSARSMEPHYGAEVVVDGFIAAAKKEARLRLLQLGRGSLRQAIQEKVETAGLKDRVHFAGQVDYDQLPAYYRSADLYLTASQADGSSISLLEAMACGLPALVSDIPGNREWVSDGKTGWFFPVGDALQLERGLMNAITQGDRLGTVGLQAREVVESRADWNHGVETMLEAYRQVLAEGR